MRHTCKIGEWGAYQPLSVVGEGAHGWCGAHTLSVLDDTCTRAVHHRHARVRRAQIHTDHVPCYIAATHTMFSRWELSNESKFVS